VVGLCWLGADRFLADSDRYLVLYGLVNLVAVTGQSVLLSTGVVLLWCAWAAVTRTAIAVHLRRTDPIVIGSDSALPTGCRPRLCPAAIRAPLTGGDRLPVPAPQLLGDSYLASSRIRVAWNRSTVTMVASPSAMAVR
jgi:hypothetical protein